MLQSAFWKERVVSIFLVWHYLSIRSIWCQCLECECLYETLCCSLVLRNVFVTHLGAELVQALPVFICAANCKMTKAGYLFHGRCELYHWSRPEASTAPGKGYSQWLSEDWWQKASLISSGAYIVRAYAIIRSTSLSVMRNHSERILSIAPAPGSIIFISVFLMTKRYVP